jgi:hypothetical protein
MNGCEKSIFPHLAALHPAFMHPSSNPSKDFSILIWVVLAGCLYCAMHITNGWLFCQLELTEHISFIYLPSFLRLANVLVLGLVWGTAGTALGGALLFFWMSDGLWLSVCNTAISAGSAAMAVVLMRVMQKRSLALTRLSDLLQLALFYSLLNALTHHLLWSLLDTSQLVNPHQLIYMVIGDVNGAVIGALVLRWLAHHTRLVQLARQKASTPTKHED